MRRKDRNKDPVGLEYMAWIKTLPCCVCVGLRNTGSEAAHIGGNFAAKASNFQTIPLCTGHHRIGPTSQEQLKGRFGDFWKIDVAALIEQLNAQFLETHRDLL